MSKLFCLCRVVSLFEEARTRRWMGRAMSEEEFGVYVLFELITEALSVVNPSLFNCHLSSLGLHFERE